MISDSVYKHACSILAERPICYSLLKYLWPYVKDYDFSKGDLIIPKPTHLIHHENVYYGHYTIRRTLRALDLKPIHLEDKTNIIIRQDKKAKVPSK